MSARILPFALPKQSCEASPEPPNESCYYSDSELHRILQELIDSGHKSLVENTLLACRYLASPNTDAKITNHNSPITNNQCFVLPSPDHLTPSER